ncbi:MAG: enolase C-terminal domain-like protein [Caldilineaceae bacterium]
MSNSIIVSIEWANFEGRRPRSAGCNARLGEHGLTVQVPLARITCADGSRGFGPCRTTPEAAQALVGRDAHELLSHAGGRLPILDEAARALEFPLWDLLGQQSGQPVYQLAAATRKRTVDEPLRVACYDTSLYIDDLHLTSEQEAAELIADEARQGVARNHTAFKIKVGRGARHMSIQEGTARDIAVIHAVRAVVGPDAAIMIDANNGYNLNLAKQVLAATADCDLFWLEEAFHEDAVLYGDLCEWMNGQDLNVLVADGEGQASPTLLDWAEQGVIDVVQYDIFSYGLANWLATAAKLDKLGIHTAPHHYGRHLGNYISGHLATAAEQFLFVEWDEATTPGIAAPGYAIENGHVTIPDSPGFGLVLDEERFAHAVGNGGFRVA